MKTALLTESDSQGNGQIRVGDLDTLDLLRNYLARFCKCSLMLLLCGLIVCDVQFFFTNHILLGFLLRCTQALDSADPVEEWNGLGSSSLKWSETGSPKCQLSTFDGFQSTLLDSKKAKGQHEEAFEIPSIISRFHQIS